LRFLVGLLCVLIVLLDAFETIVLPRTVRRPIRLTASFFATSRKALRWISRWKHPKLRQSMLNGFAPLAMIVLIGVWAVLMIIGFALMESGINVPMSSPGGDTFANRLYFSGTTFFTVGFGDFTPNDGPGKFLAVVEGGMGLGFLALVISYVPVFYNAFSRREVTMVLLDSKAGSNPTAVELLRRHAAAKCMPQLVALLKEWETFSAQLLESYLSYPVLAFYRSQHDDQSWLCALCAVMDGCALIEMGFADDPEWAKDLRFQARATFAMARHVVVDLSYVLKAEPVTGEDRLPAERLQLIEAELAKVGVTLSNAPSCHERLIETRTLYEPYVLGLSRQLIMELPDWIPESKELDNWQTSAWEIKHF
jgi:hypothetical protein